MARLGPGSCTICPHRSAPSLSCAQTPVADPYFAPQRELFAATFIPTGVGDELQP